MKKISLLAVLSLALSVSLFAQKDPKATEVLDQLSAKTKAYTSIQADFKMSVKSDDVTEEQKGKITLMGDKYKYTVFGVTKICDGINIAEIVPMDEEIILTKLKQNDPDEINPKNLFTIYEKGFKYRYIKEITENGKKLHMIELYPDGKTDNAYRRITLYITVDTIELHKAELFAKSTNKVFTFVLTNRKYNEKIAASIFKVDCSIMPDYDCDDQRKAK
jgi:outer membrane lipoprotein carrier protein